MMPSMIQDFAKSRRGKLLTPASMHVGTQNLLSNRSLIGSIRFVRRESHHTE